MEIVYRICVDVVMRGPLSSRRSLTAQKPPHPAVCTMYYMFFDLFRADVEVFRTTVKFLWSTHKNFDPLPVDFFVSCLRRQLLLLTGRKPSQLIC